MDHPLIVNFVRWIVILPLLGASVNFLAGATLQKKIGKTMVAIVGCGVVSGAFIIAVGAFAEMLHLAPDHRFMLDDLWRWLDIGGLKLDVAFWLDPLSMLLVLVVTGIGGLIHLYSTSYMHDDPAYWRFFAWLNLFTFAMLTLILADNLWLMFVGWEGVGLCSYALIGFWYRDLSNSRAGNKAFIVNRVGDWAFVIAVYALFIGLDAVGHPTLVVREIARYSPLLANRPGYLGMSLVTFATLFLFLGATGKSAQIPLHVWLPEAMAGPTPVSALIHAATMVTAGVYMVSRLNFLFSLAPATLELIAIIGASTAFFAATIGVTQNDIKRVLAYSTISQLGYMFAALGVGAYDFGVFHLMTHAFFKACLFLGAGSVIHALGGEQDMRKMGGLRRHLPVTFWTFLAATLALCGIPPFAGFMSKDGIIWAAYSRGHPVIWLMLLAGAGITVFYMFRQVYLTFFGDFRGSYEQNHHLQESAWPMASVLIVLGVLSVIGGFVMVPRFISGFAPFEDFLAPVFTSAPTRLLIATDGHQTLEIYFAIIALVVATAGWYLADACYRTHKFDPLVLSDFAGVFYRLSFNKYYVDEFYHLVVVQPYMLGTRVLAWFDLNIVDGLVNLAAAVTLIGSWTSGLIDLYVVDGLVNLAANATLAAGERIRRLQTGSVNAYLYGILATVMIILLVRAILSV